MNCCYNHYRMINFRKQLVFSDSGLEKDIADPPVCDYMKYTDYSIDNSINCSDAKDVMLCEHAHLIHDTIENKWAHQGTTILCVILKDTKEEKDKKFAFSNVIPMLPVARNEANRLKYHVIMAEPGHAEMQLLQFLQYHKHYKVIAMQCSRPYCFRCYFVLTEHPRTKMCANGIKQDQIEGRKCGKIFPILKKKYINTITICQ